MNAIPESSISALFASNLFGIIRIVIVVAVFFSDNWLAGSWYSSGVLP